MTRHGFYLHPPGLPSRWSVIDIGLRCFHQCSFCYSSYLGGGEDQFEGMRRAEFYPKEHLFKLIDTLVDSGFLGADYTGGEPAAHPDIVEVTKYAIDRGLAIRMITLGQYLMRKMKSAPKHERLIDGLLDAGITNFLFSYHASTEDVFKKITGESLLKLTQAMTYLDSKGFQYTTNTTVYEENYRLLPEIARSLTSRGTYLHNFILMNAYYEWSDQGKSGPVQAKYGDVSPYLKEAVRILESNGIGVNIRYAPLCTIAGFEKNHVGIVGVRYDPYEWMNCVDHAQWNGGKAEGVAAPELQGRPIPMQVMEPSPGSALWAGYAKINDIEVMAGRGGSSENLSKVFTKDKCSTCSAIHVCDGVDPRYIGLHGDDELSPYINDNRGKTIDRQRVAYKAPFFVKLKPMADIKKAVRRSFQPIPVSDNPIVSIIITCYNKAKWLNETLDSVEKQTYENIEVVFVDDASTDTSLDIWKSHGLAHKSTTIERKENGGLPAISRNLGLQSASGELVVCLDADDILEPSYISECVEAFHNHPEAGIVYTSLRCIGDEQTQWTSAPYDYLRLVQANYICCASMFRRSAWEEVGGYDETPELRGVEDYFFWVTLGSYGHTGAYIPRSLWKYRVDKSGIFKQDVEKDFKGKCRAIAARRPDLYGWLIKNGWQQ